MIRNSTEILASLSHYANPNMKLKRLVAEGQLYRLRRGLYATKKNIPPYLLAGAIYGPSYVSFESALSLHGLIPERVYACTSATFGKNRSKNYKNEYGVFYYRDVPESVYPAGVCWQQEGEWGYAVALPEKALCDMLYIKPPVYSLKALKELLFDDLRIDEDEFWGLKREDICRLVPFYHKRNLSLLGKLLQTGR